MSEGSTEIDTGGVPTSSVQDDSSQDDSQVQNQGNSENRETDTQLNNQDEDSVQLTEKGTKLDPNPLSAAHQQLANEQRIRKQYEQVLNSPELLRKYAQEAGYSLAEAKAEIKDEQKKLFTADSFKTPDDVANALNKIHDDHEKSLAELRKENEQLKKGFTGFNEQSRREQVATNMQRDLSTITSKYPELDHKNPAYNPDLEKEIALLYHRIDAVDPQDASKGYKGQFSLAEIADSFMRAAGKAEKVGSQKAQTDIKVKQAGRVVTSSKTASQEESESKDPGTVIAQRIAKAMGHK